MLPKRLVQEADERLGIFSALRRFGDQPVSGGARIRHVFPAVLVYLFVQQAILGIVLAAYYSPSATDAWASTAYLSDKVTLGWLIRGMHYHGTSVFIIISGLYLGSLAVFRSYRRPREVIWWASIAIVLLGMGLGVTGNPLPWDEEGFWGILVELNIAEQTPGGIHIRTFIQGGSDTGNFTILRLYMLHVFVLPLALAAVLGIVLHQTRRHGHPPPPELGRIEAERRTVPYFPFQAFWDVLAMVVVAGTIITMTVMTHGAELYAPADPTSGFQAKPAWYFMFLYKLRMIFESIKAPVFGGNLEPVATMVIPGMMAGFLVSVPFIDAYLGRRGRAIVLGGMAAVVLLVVGMTGIGLMSDAKDEEFQKAMALAHKDAERARGLAVKGVAPEGGAAVFWNDPEFKVKMLYKEHCQSCHALDGIGGGEAPDLTDYSSRTWLAGMIRNTQDPRFFGKTKHDDMDPYPEDALPQEQLDAVVEYLVSLRKEPADATLVEKGKTLWEDELECNACHEVEPGESGSGPNLFGHGSSEWIARVIRDPSQEDLFGEEATMPKFDGKLSDDEIEELSDFIARQRMPKAEAEPEAEAAE